MKRYMVALSVLGIAPSVVGYQKFRCMDCLLTSQEQSSFVATPSFSLKKASYVMVDSHGITTSYVSLSVCDRGKIAKELRRYDSKKPITQDLINSYKRPAWRRNHVVGLVLQDFKSMKETATVGDVLKALKL